MSITTTTTYMGLTKYWRGHPIRDTDIAANMDRIDYYHHALDTTIDAGVRVVKGDLVDGIADTFAFTWQNPESTAVLVQRVVVDVATQATAAAVMDVGVVASATATAATIFDDLTLDSVAVYDHMLVSGTGAGGVHKVDANGGSNDWITGKILTQSGADLVGKYYIEYVVV